MQTYSLHLQKSVFLSHFKKKKRRANRINLIADDVDDVTALDDIEGAVPDTETGRLGIRSLLKYGEVSCYLKHILLVYFVC